MKMLSDLDNRTNAAIVKGIDVGGVVVTVPSFDALEGALPSLLANRVVIQLDPKKYRVYSADGVEYTEGEWEPDIPLDLVVETLTATENISLPNGKNITLGQTSQRSYNNTTLICEANVWQWKDLDGNHLATVSADGFDLNSAPLLSVTDIKIDNSGTVSFYSSTHQDQSMNWFNSGDISVGVKAGGCIDLGFGGSVVQSFNESALDMGNTKVTTLKDGVINTDAATVGQTITIGDLSNPYYFQASLKELQDVSSITFSNSGTYADIRYKNANSYIRFFNSDSIYMTIGTASYASFDIFSGGTQKYSLGLVEFDIFNKKIVNLSGGSASSDAATYGQLLQYKAGNSYAHVETIKMGSGLSAALDYTGQLTISGSGLTSNEVDLKMLRVAIESQNEYGTQLVLDTRI